MAHSAQRQSGNSKVAIHARHSALGMGVEDINGLWELLWELRHQFPDSEESTLRTVSQQVLSQLVQQNLIRIVRWNPAVDSEIELAPESAVQQIAANENWLPPESRTKEHLRFIATPGGFLEYYGEGASA